MFEQVNRPDQKFDIFKERFPAFINILKDESERGSVIVGATFLEEALEQLLKKRLVPSPEKSDKLFNGAYAPLSNFSAKIDFSYRVGIIGLNRRTSLHIIRRLRNDFAHSSLQISFESQKVHSRVQELFTLNKSLLDLIWRTLEDAQNQILIDQIGPYEANHGVDYLIKIMGWKSTFEFLTAMIAATLYTFEEDLETIVSLDVVKDQATKS